MGRVKEEFSGNDEKFSDLLGIFKFSWIKGQYFSLNYWNYFRALNEDTLHVKKLKFKK